MIMITLRVVLKIKDVFGLCFSNLSKHQKTWGLKRRLLCPTPIISDSLGLRWPGSVHF